MLKELIAQRRAIDAQIVKVRSEEGKSKIKELIKEYGLTPEYLHNLATRLKEKGIKK